jgi:hypothetical protein
MAAFFFIAVRFRGLFLQEPLPLHQFLQLGTRWSAPRNIGHHLLSIVAILASANSLALEVPRDGIEGNWTIKEIVDVAPISGLNDNELQALLGGVVTVSSEKIEFGSRICDAPSLKLSHGRQKAFFREYRIHTPHNWSGTIDRIDIRCAPPHTFGPLLVNGENMLFVWYGALVRASRDVGSTKSEKKQGQ